MIKVEIDVNVKGLDFLKGLIGSNLGVSETARPADTAPAWTTNEVPKEEISQPPVQAPVQPPVQPPAQSAPVGEVAYTLEQLKNAAIGLVQSGVIQSTDIFPILNDLGVADMSKLTPDKFNAFAMKLKELGGVI